MASQWFCRVLGQEIGPVSFQEMAEMVRAGTLKETDPVRRDGASKWTRAREVIGLFRAAAKEPAPKQPQPKTPPKPSPAPAKAKEAERTSAATPRIGRRRAVLAGGFVLGLVILVAGISLWRSYRRERFPEPLQSGPRVVTGDPMGPLLAERSTTASIPVPDDPVPQPASGDATRLKDQYTIDFREDFESEAIALRVMPKPGVSLGAGDSPAELFAVEPAGMRVTIPGDSRVDFCRAALRIRIKGDFQVTARYTILNLEPPKGGYGPGIGISLQDAEGERSALQRVFRVREGHVFTGVRGLRQPDGKYQYRKYYRDTSSEALSGWLRMVREGNRVRYQVAGPHGEQFVQIHEDECPPNDVTAVPLKVQTGGSPTAIDAVFSYFDVQADQIVKDFSPAKG